MSEHIDQTAALRRHLDIGCGLRPGNPYGRPDLFGVDIRDIAPVGIDYRRVNLTLAPIPFPDNHFGSVSAFDYLEHVPRLIVSSDGQNTLFPFVRLMSEIWRVLTPGGRFFALTPAYPRAEAFQDPTHVNIITPATHLYFCGHQPPGAMYGFDGKFNSLRTGFVVNKDAVTHTSTLRQKLRWFKYAMQGRLSHFLWELEAVK